MGFVFKPDFKSFLLQDLPKLCVKEQSYPALRFAGHVKVDNYLENAR